jgi:hypothetical protein|tara:strand:+ start:260 stop:451 length:192 start_codon:yes stop_codon:yes gene_type:complete
MEINMQRCVECNEVTKNDWVSHETDEGVVCIDCADIPEDDGQPSWEQEWQDFGEVYDDEPNTI